MDSDVIAFYSKAFKGTMLFPFSALLPILSLSSQIHNPSITLIFKNLWEIDRKYFRQGVMG